MAGFYASADAHNDAHSVSQSGDADIWQNLKSAIAASSGFQRWKLESLNLDPQFNNFTLDQVVQRYLRETLETLAY
ncbi:MAG: hypothetical protein H0X31_16295 [Nostocaceae cyanobacterium]|nr:hypothetical protein [Nostocaceae cyanobacterium]